MRPFLTLLLLAGSAVAYGDGMKYTPLVEVDVLAPGCRLFAQSPRNTRIDGPAYDAAISAANCDAMVRMHDLVLSPTATSIAALDHAMAPAFAILDLVIDAGDPEHRLAASSAEVDLLEGSVARMFSALPLSPQMSKDEVDAHQHAVDSTSVLVEPWQRRALKLRRDVAQLVAAHPELATRDQVDAYLVAHTRLADAAGLGARR
jgi:hypothetical protein